MEGASVSSSNNDRRERRHSHSHSLSRLVLYAPLISTRRSASSGSANSVSRSNSTRQSGTTQRVPFSWESSPGVPKSLGAAWHDGDDDDDSPLPLPPKLQAGQDGSKTGKLQILVNEAYRPSDGSYDDDGEEEEIFSDALDKISLSEKFDIACRLSSMDRNNGSDMRRSPSFIMNRFLPAANALANASVRSDAHFGRRVQKEMVKAGITRRAAAVGKARFHLPQQFDQNSEARRPELNSMACGLMLFFPWSLKPTVCGFKSPARGGATRLDEPSGCGLRSPAGVRTARAPNRAPPSPRRRGVKGFSERWSSDVEDNGGGGYVGKMSVIKINQSWQGCGLPFLDTSRLWSKARRVGIGGERKQRREKTAGKSRRATWRLTQLTSPSESWLSHATGYVNRGH